MSASHSGQKGFSLVTAIFLLVVLASLGAMMTTFFTAQQQTSAVDVLDVRAYQAARAGVEWGAFQLTQSGVVGGAFATACQPGPTSSSVPLTGALSVYSVTVECSATSAMEGADTTWIYDLTSTASGVNQAVPGGGDYVESKLQVLVWTIMNPGGASQVVVWK
jgi:MSHA biogenesis protein MshP